MFTKFVIVTALSQHCLNSVTLWCVKAQLEVLLTSLLFVHIHHLFHEIFREKYGNVETVMDSLKCYYLLILDIYFLPMHTGCSVIYSILPHQKGSMVFEQ